MSSIINAPVSELRGSGTISLHSYRAYYPLLLPQKTANMAEVAVGEIVNVVVAVAFIALVVSWATSSKETPEQKTIRTTLGFKPKQITPDMVSPQQARYL